MSAGASPRAQDIASGDLEETLIPRSSAELAAQLKTLHADGRPALIVGGGTKLERGNPPHGVRVALHTSGLSGIRELDAEEGVLCAGAGTPIGDLRRAAAEASWVFPLDPPEGEPSAATLGGVLATDDLGPRHLALGRPRDVVLGLETVLGDGCQTRSGGRVVKNVTGYDLMKLQIGALGTLGVMSEAWIRLRPAPEAVRVLAVPVGELAPEHLEAARLPGVRAAAYLSAGASSQAFDDRRPRLLIEFADLGDSVDASVAALFKLLSDETVEDRDETAIDRVRAFQGSCPPAGLRVRLVALPSRLASVTKRLSESGAELLVYPATGLVYAFFSSDVAEAWESARRAAREGGGPLRLEALTPELATERPALFDAFGEAQEGAEIARELKNRFDPAGVLNPGRFSGGL